MEELFLPGIPADERKQLMMDSCDRVVERSYTRRYSQEDTNRARAELAEGCMELDELRTRLDAVKAEFKGRMKPIVERNAQLVMNLKAGGEFVTTDCYLIVDEDEGADPSGRLIEERPMTAAEKSDIFRGVRQEAVRLAKEQADEAVTKDDKAAI